MATDEVEDLWERSSRGVVLKYLDIFLQFYARFVQGQSQKESHCHCRNKALPRPTIKKRKIEKQFHLFKRYLN
jgi:hypothetical protein